MIKQVMMTSVILVLSSSAVFASHPNFKDEKPINVVVQTKTTNTALISYAGIAGGIINEGSYKGFTGNLFTGLGERMGSNNDFYLGGEIFADAMTLALSGNQYMNREVYGLGASIIPGVMLNDKTMVYGRLGAKASRYKDWYHTIYKGQVGAGVQTVLTDNWNLRAEYVRTGAKSGANQVNVGVLYKFN